MWWRTIEDEIRNRGRSLNEVKGIAGDRIAWKLFMDALWSTRSKRTQWWWWGWRCSTNWSTDHWIKVVVLHVRKVKYEWLKLGVINPYATNVIYIYGAPILDVSRSHTTMQHSRYDSSGRVISSSQRPLPDNTWHSQQTNIHAPGGIQTQDLSRRAAIGHSPAEILGSNPTGGMDICLLWVSCVVR